MAIRRFGQQQSTDLDIGLGPAALTEAELQSGTYLNWMRRDERISRRTIGNMILAATHNAGTYKGHPNSNNFVTCQDVPVYDQLVSGVRVLDFRVRWINGGSRFYIEHDSVFDPVESIFHGYGRYRDRGCNDIVIMDFHSFDGFDAEKHRQFSELIERYFSNVILPPRWQHLTVNSIFKMTRRNLVIAYNSSYRSANFWPGVAHQWIGKNTPSTDELKAYMDSVAASPPSNLLWAIQAHKRTKLFNSPDDFSDKINAWFFSENGYSQNFTIISTDWTTRSEICREAYWANYHVQHYTYFTVPQAPPDIFQPWFKYGSGLVVVENGSWAPRINLPTHSLRGGELCEIYSGADYEVQVYKADGVYMGTLRRGTAMVFENQFLQGRGWVLLASYQNEWGLLQDPAAQPSLEPSHSSSTSGLDLQGSWGIPSSTEQAPIPLPSPDELELILAELNVAPLDDPDAILSVEVAGDRVPVQELLHEAACYRRDGGLGVLVFNFEGAGLGDEATRLALHRTIDEAFGSQLLAHHWRHLSIEALMDLADNHIIVGWGHEARPEGYWPLLHVAPASEGVSVEDSLRDALSNAWQQH